MHPAERDELERRGDSLLDEEAHRRDRLGREEHIEFLTGTSSGIWLVTRGSDHIRVSCSGLHALSTDQARTLAEVILDYVGEIDG